jgi:DNA primase
MIRRSPEQEQAFRQRVDAAKGKKNLSDVVARRTKLKRRSRGEMVGLCPFHEEKTPSFEVNDAKGVFYCHGCGASGDHFTFLTRADGLSFRHAYEALAGDTFPTVDPAERTRQRLEDERIRRAAIGDALWMWDQCGDPGGTIAETYLRETRAITMKLPAAVRFGVVPISRDMEGQWRRAFPAVVLASTDGGGEIVGLQRIFLSDDGRQKRWGKRSKLSLGRPRGSAVRLQAGTSGRLIICEGPEDGLSLAQELPADGVHVALGTAMMPLVPLPPTQRVVTIAGQNDKPGHAAVKTCVDAFGARGIETKTMFPADGYKDWNDMLRGIRA